jgi:hypothetical protein
MVKQPKYYFEAMLGITSPWSIQDVAIDEKNRIIQLELTYSVEKSRFSFFTKATQNQPDRIIEAGTTKRWFHTSFGYYNCYILSSFFDQSASASGISRDALIQANFLGCANRNYTHQLRQQVALADIRGLTPEAIANTQNIELTLVEEILADIEKTPESYRAATFLPTEADPVWERIITDKLHLKTQAFSLKLLLSKLKLTFYDSQNEHKTTDSINELRKYFIAHANSLEAEYSQVCALSSKKKAVEERRNTALKLVLPALKNSIWLKIISNKINLQSNNMPLNLFLVRSRHAFQNTSDNNIRVSVLNSIREFFRKNARTLKSELILINKLMNEPEGSQFTLPDEQHKIWVKILKDDNFIPSSHMAYRLLLANLRSQMLMNPDPLVELSAARRLRDFINHNQRFMQDELRQVMRISHSN